MLEVEPSRFADRSDVGCGSRSRGKGDSKIWAWAAGRLEHPCAGTNQPKKQTKNLWVALAEHKARSGDVNWCKLAISRQWHLGRDRRACWLWTQIPQPDHPELSLSSTTISCVTLGKTLHLSGLHYSICKTGKILVLTTYGCYRLKWVNIHKSAYNSGSHAVSTVLVFKNKNQTLN